MLEIKNVELQTKLDGSKKSLAIILYIKKGTIGMVGTEKLICLLDDGTTVSLPIIGVLPSVEGKGTGLLYTFNYTISDTNLDKLSKGNITDIRVEAYMNSVDIPILKTISTVGIFKCISN